MKHITHRAKRYFFPIVVGTVAIIAFAFVTFNYLWQAREDNDIQIAQHIEKLSQIFTQIESCCNITGFRSQKDFIDFLNVSSFEGSQVGPMNLEHPEKWTGPYVKNNLSIEGKLYQVIQYDDKYYIVPGDGVKLANGKVIGETLILNSKSDLPALMSDSNALYSNIAKKPLAAEILYTRN